ncbi:Na+/H+ antiporter NhaA [Algimonas porphyrae]|uniref:Na(+)/H(+) antiporter NhaA n=1 Tax=Algimonas porphyrae TaxID=1128113 RepID=A0ABQ5V0G9_9PROT|nr:Na+/H+ antiporter NhaA [Algimonas porphyrae]GLQ20941.1 Na(+)/H(+) antiporter NhaA [Algimonas porphyrae]
MTESAQARKPGPGRYAPRSIRERAMDFIHMEASGGIVLMFMALLALIANNSLLSSGYTGILDTTVKVQFGDFIIQKPFLLWINDGLMAIFFFLVGLEIKREVLDGELSSMDKASLPLFAAVGGIVAPALVYLAFNYSNPVTIDGWAIPAATDIAFALGIIALLGPRVPASLKIFLLAVAIIDDLAAIIIIALFYTENLSLIALSWAAIGTVALFALNRMRVMRILPYALIGVFVWAAVLKSGVHATLAGVITALAIPLARPDPETPSPLSRAEHGLHIWVAFLILPLFAFANAGVSLGGLSFADLLSPIPLGIALGLFFGKQIGVFLLSYLAVKLKLAKLPEGANWPMVYGVACLTGVGFTMSLFIGTLAFDDPELLNGVRLGVLMGSIASGLLGFFLLRMFCKAAPTDDDTIIDAVEDLSEDVKASSSRGPA